MILTNILNNLKQQNWLGIALELIVVVVGIVGRLHIVDEFLREALVERTRSLRVVVTTIRCFSVLSSSCSLFDVA